MIYPGLFAQKEHNASIGWDWFNAICQVIYKSVFFMFNCNGTIAYIDRVWLKPYVELVEWAQMWHESFAWQC